MGAARRRDSRSIMSQDTITQQLTDLGSAVEHGNRARARQLVESLLELGAAPTSVLDAMVQAMEEVGQSFQCREIFIPQMILASRTMSESVALLEPTLVAAGIEPKYRAVIGTVAGDVHDLGKNLVAMMWRGAGFAVIDLGTNVPPTRFLEIAREQHPNLVGVSALLTTTMPVIKETVDALEPVRSDGIRVVVGGAPVTQAFADKIGADGYAPDAARAVDVAPAGRSGSVTELSRASPTRRCPRDPGGSSPSSVDLPLFLAPYSSPMIRCIDVGNSDSNSNRSPVAGCSKPNDTAWSAIRFIGQRSCIAKFRP